LLPLSCAPSASHHLSPVIRPADPEETAGAFVAAFTRTDGPTMLSLSRQALPNLSQIPVEVRRNGVLTGGYVAVQETAPLDTILLSCGSELQHAVAAAAQLGPGTRVVSMPSQHRFDKQPAEYKEKVLPRSCRKRVAIEAGVTCSWAKYIGLDGAIIGIDRFGMLFLYFFIFSVTCSDTFAQACQHPVTSS
jgi:transketolase